MNGTEKYSDMNDLFDEVARVLNLREYQLFMEALRYNKREALQALCSFERDVSTCPDIVVRYVQKLLQEHVSGKGQDNMA